MLKENIFYKYNVLAVYTTQVPGYVHERGFFWGAAQISSALKGGIIPLGYETLRQCVEWVSCDLLHSSIHSIFISPIYEILSTDPLSKNKYLSILKH